MTRESVIEQHLVDVVKARGGMAPKFKSPQRRGAPDRLVLLPGGRIAFAELKATGEKPEPHQLREHDRLRALGFEVAVIDSIEGFHTWFATLVNQMLYAVVVVDAKDNEWRAVSVWTNRPDAEYEASRLVARFDSALVLPFPANTPHGLLLATPADMEFGR